MHKKIAVLLASYNGVKYIKEQVDSILNQKEVDVTIFISDDLSTDKTIEYLQDIYKDFKNIVYLPSGSKFGGAGKNFFRLIRDVDFSSFDFISFVDQDDIWYDDKLIRAINTIKDKQIDAYSSNVLAFWEDGKEMIINKSSLQARYDYIFEAAGPGCTYVLKKDLAIFLQKFICENWEEVNKVELHDWFIYAFARENNYKWHIDEKPSMRYRQHTSNQVGANDGLKAKLKRLKKVLSSWYREEIIKIIKVLRLENKYKFSKYILNKSYLNNLLLLKYSFEFRRNKKEKIFLFILFIFGIF
ncbi:glycosyltransferase [Aliarcobacter skirrowii]|uniref:Glycosyltransferase, family 2 n=1 Tax=Aliarcobacter skirrowii CCUG 10374 TaxID=1032239 RepID=A0AAD0WNX3_9BACT|nr:glycosyltransferase [Aliarcobacter skirrowii]AXX84940.1 glycosyltransferase, family 2 [Aliarcobacter skirrowii CCUG 10374]SUU96537.1 Chondroitin polymerase [Aliarcobacter skirrowii]